MNVFLAARYLQHRLRAKNRHGLHSPYIYKLLDDIVYDFAPKPIYDTITASSPPKGNHPNPRKVNRLLYRLVQYFNPNVLAVADGINAATRLYIVEAKNAEAVPWTQLLSADVIICDATTIPTASLKPGGIIIALNIHATEAARQNWQQLKASPHINVTADLFYLGLAFNRPQQAEEHFKLRF